MNIMHLTLLFTILFNYQSSLGSLQTDIEASLRGSTTIWRGSDDWKESIIKEGATARVNKNKFLHNIANRNEVVTVTTTTGSLEIKGEAELNGLLDFMVINTEFWREKAETGFTRCTMVEEEFDEGDKTLKFHYSCKSIYDLQDFLRIIETADSITAPQRDLAPGI